MRNSALAQAVAAAIIGACLVGLSGVAPAQIMVNQNIAVSTTWTADNTYNLINQIYVLPGATLTIEAGTVIASTPTANGSGSLAVTKGARIYVEGTNTNPVIMTSTADVATWASDPSHPTGGDPTTGTWRQAANEWGNLTLMGGAYISENATPGNVASCNANNVASMEGLTAGFPGDPKVLYGGGNDDDDSGSISYLSIRYGGRVVGLANELNGLSLGGIGRETDIHHVEIMNNVDDGIEIWGGTVNLKHLSIWNIGDDSFDVDQGWRGKAQFGLIVQGYSLDASQGSGVGDNCIETDGAEDSNWQPITTATIYNFTVIGQPADGDHATAWRDNARVQHRNSIFCDIGDELVRFDNVDGDGANGYGHMGTLDWPSTWTTPYTYSSTQPGCPTGTYAVQSSGMLAEMRGCVFSNIGDTTEATARGVFNPANDNITVGSCPVASLTRAAPVIKGGSKVMQQVTWLDPRPNGIPAPAQAAPAYPADDFFSYAPYRGAFAPGVNWLSGWTASQAFGFTPADYVAPATAPGQPGVSGQHLMDINGARNASGHEVGDPSSPAGPHYTTISVSDTIRFDIEGPANEAVILLFSPTLAVGNFPIGPGQQLDIGSAIPFNLGIFADGSQPGILNSFFQTQSGGTMAFQASTAGVIPGFTVNFQALLFPSLKITNAINVTVN